MAVEMYAGIIIDQAHPALDKLFHYRIPREMTEKVQLGMRVLVPFGPGNRGIEGYIISIDRETDIPPEKIKYVKRIMDTYPVILKELIPLIKWMKNEYHCMAIEAIRCFIPPGLRRNIPEKTQKIVFLKIERDLKGKIAQVETRSKYMGEILRILDQGDGIPLTELADMAGGAPLSSFKNLEKRDWISIEDQRVYRDPWDQPLDTIQNNIVHNIEQTTAIDIIGKGMLNPGSIFLLHGVTGSGKTEVYMALVEKTIRKGMGVIILVPEIALTPQTVRHFKQRFGNNVAVLHSRLSLGERFDEWKRIYNGLVKIVVGARSAIFAPMRKLGLIVIDEAHEDSYKSEARPRYHTTGLAIERCREQGATLVLGTATPSLEDYYNSAENRYIRVSMDHRIDNKPLPEVEVVDMRLELKKGNRSVFSQALYDGLRDVLRRGEQAIILLNRRGYAQFVSCRSCGYVVKCKNCDISLTYHAKNNILKCHYCGDTRHYPKECPACKSTYIKHFGIGTQKVEHELNRLLPIARTVRMDMDTTSAKGAHQKILNDFGEGKYDILLGTQMVAKGLDFPHVTLSGVIAADTSLNLPDYRSSEKTFQLITQVAGRAGRGKTKGRVIVQTYQPDHYSIRHASSHDYIGFYHEEIRIREQFMYPPFCHIIRLLISGENERSVIKMATSIEQWIRQRIDNDSLIGKGTIELGAYPAPLEKIKNKFRWHVLIRVNKERIFIERYHEIIDECIKGFTHGAETIAIDFYPTSLL
ncbi:MAG: primosomal protein N' [Clostridiales bacterium]|nr:primosomal protein N' [Clostridiales bacterium]